MGCQRACRTLDFHYGSLLVASCCMLKIYGPPFMRTPQTQTRFQTQNIREKRFDEVVNIVGAQQETPDGARRSRRSCSQLTAQDDQEEAKEERGRGSAMAEAELSATSSAQERSTVQEGRLLGRADVRCAVLQRTRELRAPRGLSLQLSARVLNAEKRGIRHPSAPAVRMARRPA